MDRKSRLAIRVALFIPLAAALMFVPTGSFEFWQANCSNAVSPAVSSRRQQRRVKMLWVPLWIGTITLPGLDYRCQWSAHREEYRWF